MINDPGQPPLASDFYAQQQMLLEITRRISREPNIDPLLFFPQVLKSLSKYLNLKQMGIYLLDDYKKQLHLIEQLGLPPRQPGWRILRLNDNSPLDACLSSGQPQSGHMPALGWIMAAPIVGVDMAVGIITIICPREPDRESWRQWKDFLSILGYLLGIAMEHAGLVNELLRQIEVVNYLQRQEFERASLLEDQNRSLQRLIITDPLTGLVNRRHLSEKLEREIARHQHTGDPFCLCLIDIDHFKSVNDTLGHSAGDQALVLLAEWLTQGLRRADVVSRYGGEEFVIILTNCDLNAGIRIAEQLRIKVETASQTPPFDRQGGFTISAGILQYQNSMSLAQLLDLADAAMYRAKRAGRNRVEHVRLPDHLI
jgi:diguanylate cyclase (GGDEF)-like protein